MAGNVIEIKPIEPITVHSYKPVFHHGEPNMFPYLTDTNCPSDFRHMGNGYVRKDCYYSWEGHSVESVIDSYEINQSSSKVLPLDLSKSSVHSFEHSEISNKNKILSMIVQRWLIYQRSRGRLKRIVPLK